MRKEEQKITWETVMQIIVGGIIAVLLIIYT